MTKRISISKVGRIEGRMLSQLFVPSRTSLSLSYGRDRCMLVQKCETALDEMEHLHAPYRHPGSLGLE